MIEFLLHHVLRDSRGPIICGRCGDHYFGVGDMFLALWWVYNERDEQSKEWVELDAGKAAEVQLRVEEIGYFNSTIERLYPVSAAGIRFSGQGLEQLLKIDYDAELRAGRVWSLRGPPDAARVVAPDRPRT